MRTAPPQRPPAGRTLLAAACVALPALSRAEGGGFEHALAIATQRVVKLYGLGAGIQAGYGTGVLVSAEGHVLTVDSLLIDARTVRAVTADGARYEAAVLYRDPSRQLALLSLRAPQASTDSALGPFPCFDLTRPTSLREGDWIVAAGNPFKIADGVEQVSIMHGVYSARTRLDARRRMKEFPYHGDVLILDAITSNPGASGSAVVNLKGEFVGMIGRVVLSRLTHTHVNYAMPRDVLADFYVEALATLSAPRPGSPPFTPRSGVKGYAGGPDPNRDREEAAPDPARAARSGVSPETDLGIHLVRTGYRKLLPFVDRVRPGSPADRAGLRRDDLVLSVTGSNVPDVESFDARLAILDTAEPVLLVIRRGRTVKQVHLKAEREP